MKAIYVSPKAEAILATEEINILETSNIKVGADYIEDYPVLVHPEQDFLWSTFENED